DAYNEIFHAWWHFRSETDLESYYWHYIRHADNMAAYARANPSNPDLAREEAYSETVSVLAGMMMTRETAVVNDTGGYDYINQAGIPPTQIQYSPGSVASVGHSDRPGYTPQADHIYPTAGEYEIILRIMLGRARELSDWEIPRNAGYDHTGPSA